MAMCAWQTAALASLVSSGSLTPGSTVTTQAMLSLAGSATVLTRMSANTSTVRVQQQDAQADRLPRCGDGTSSPVSGDRLNVFLPHADITPALPSTALSLLTAHTSPLCVLLDCPYSKPPCARRCSA